MIASSELRVGNWVKNWDILVDNKTRAGKPHRISQNDFAFPDLFDPIPLTPDLLKKCGFFSLTPFTYKHPLLSCFVLKCNEEYEAALHIGWWAYLTDNNKNLLSCYEVNYLHQLQNLFFFLLGEELEIQF
jgi:hypothetical protein